MKITLLSLLSLALFMSASAQQFDEADLIGKWDVVSITGELPLGIISFTSLELGDGFYERVDYTYNEVYTGYNSGVVRKMKYIEPDEGNPTYDYWIVDFFICNNNKLHIQIGDDWTLRFVINEMTKTDLSLSTYDKSCTVTLKRTNATNITEASQPINNSNTYNLNGQIVEQMEPNNVYIKNGIKVMVNQ